jgi:hypothetical protein
MQTGTERFLYTDCKYTRNTREHKAVGWEGNTFQSYGMKCQKWGGGGGTTAKRGQNPFINVITRLRGGQIVWFYCNRVNFLSKFYGESGKELVSNSKVPE